MLGRDANLRRIAGLDPAVDHDEIFRLVTQYEFPWEYVQGTSIAFMRDFAVPSISALLDRTGEFEHHGQKRYDDTILIGYEATAETLESPRGRAAVRHLNRIHGAYDIPNDEFVYVLATTLVGPKRFIDAFGRRPLHPHEVEAMTRVTTRFGELMGISHLPSTYAGYERYLDGYEAERFAYAPQNRRVAEAAIRIVTGWYPRPLRPLVRRVTIAMLDEPLRVALGLPRQPRALTVVPTAVLRLRARVLRLMPPRPASRPYLHDARRTYPFGYPRRPRTPPVPRQRLTRPTRARRETRRGEPPMDQATVLQQRTAIEERIDGRTMCTALERTVREHGGDPAYSDKVGVAEGWRTVTWAQLREHVLDAAAGLAVRGLAPGDALAIMAGNRTEHVTADLAAVHAGGIPMSVYATLAPEQVDFVAGHAEPSVVVLEGADQLGRWELALSHTDSVSTVVALGEGAMRDDPRFVTWDDLLAEGRRARAEDAAAYDALWQAVRPDHPLTVLYTSGTTGNPKGVVLTHHNILFETESSLETSRMFDPGRTISYLPFAHIAERMLGMYIPQYQGGHVHLVSDPALLVGALGEVRPTRFFGVPRVWEKIRTGISGLLAAETDEEKKAGVTAAMEVGLRYVESRQAGHETPPELAERFAAVDAAVLTPMRALLGLDQVEWAASAAAPMPLEVARFFAGLGLEIYDVYGMTETSAVVTANGPGAFRLGTVGRPITGVEVRLGEDDEILVRGPVATPGYFKQEDATRALVDPDGWVHTGDIGRVDEDGFWSVVDRKKEMIITSAGKNIAPSNIENYLKESPLVGHALVFGEGRPYVVAVLTLDGEVAPVVAQKMGIEFQDLADLAQKPQVRALVQQAVDAANARLSRPEQVKKFELLPVEWSAESEELTPTLKLKRRVVHQKYQDVLERLYA